MQKCFWWPSNDFSQTLWSIFHLVSTLRNLKPVWLSGQKTLPLFHIWPNLTIITCGFRDMKFSVFWQLKWYEGFTQLYLYLLHTYIMSKVHLDSKVENSSKPILWKKAFNYGSLLLAKIDRGEQLLWSSSYLRSPSVTYLQDLLFQLKIMAHSLLRWNWY